MSTVALFAHRWAAAAPTGMGRAYHGIADGLAAVLAAEGASGPAAAGWEVVRTSAAEGGVAPGPLPWRALRGPRKLRLAAWRALGAPRIERSLGPIDLVHSLHPFVPVPSAAPLVQSVMDTIPLDHPEWYRRFERWGFAGGYGSARGAAAVVVASHEVGRRVVALGVDAERIAVVPLGVDRRFRSPVPDDVVAAVAGRHGVVPGRYLLAVGQVSTRKNIDVLLDALARTGRTGGVELLVVGPDAVGAGEICRRAAAPGTAGRVRFAGFVDDGDLPALVAGARALLHPSTEEGFGFPPLEAMAVGTPAVVADAGSLPEVAGAAAVVVPARDADAWAAAIEEVRTDEVRHADLRRRGRVHVADFTWEATAVGLLAVWRAVLGGVDLPATVALR